MDNKSDEKLLIVQSIIEANKQDSDEKMNNLTEDLTGMIASMMDQIKISKSSIDKKGSPKDQDHTTLAPANKKDPPPEGGYSTKIGGMWTLKHEISSTKVNELLIKIDLKGDTGMYLKNFYNYINMRPTQFRCP